jgi:hypothetical protein
MIRSFFIGLLHASRGWKMILLLLVANNLITIPLVVPIFWLVAYSTGRTLTADRMYADKLDVRWITDVINQQVPGFSFESTGIQIGLLLAVLALIYLLMNTFFTGGIIEVLAMDYGRFTMRRFWGGCGAYFWRLFRLMLISMLFYGVVGFAFYLLQTKLDLAAAQATSYEAFLYQRWGSMALLVILLGFVNMVFDYAKIRAVVEDSRAMFSGAIRALGFTLSHFFSVSVLYLLIALFGIVLFFLLVQARNSVVQSSVLTISATILLSQTAVAAQIWTRMTFYAAELDFYRRYKPKKVLPLPPHLTGDADSAAEVEEGIGASMVMARVRGAEPALAPGEGLDEHQLPQASLQSESEGKESL